MRIKKADKLNEQWKDKEFESHCSKCKVLRIWQPEESRQIYVEFVQYSDNNVYGMTLKNFENDLKRYN